MKKLHKLLFLLGCFQAFISSAQHLTISNTGQTGTSGTNWSISNNILQLAVSGSANVHPSVIENHLTNNGDLTISIPKIIGTNRNIIISNSINYTGNNNRTLYLNAPNYFYISSGANLTSTNAALNLVFRAICLPGSPDAGFVQIVNSIINTNGGHLWIAGGPTDATWNGLTVGNHYARTWQDDAKGLEITGSSITTNGGHLYIAGYSWNSANTNGNNYGIYLDNSSFSTNGGNIEIDGYVNGLFATGAGTRIDAITGHISFNTTTGNIWIKGYGGDSSGAGIGSWRHGLMVNSENPGLYKVSISTTSGDITLNGTAAFSNSTVNDAEGLYIGSIVVASGINISSQTGNILLTGSNTRSTTGQFCNGIRLNAGNITKAICIGDDGVTTYSGNITMRANAILQRNNQASAGSISVKTQGALTVEPLDAQFTHLRSGSSGTLTFDNDWDFGTAATAINIGKSTNTFGYSISNAITANGPINIYSGALTLNANLSSTNAGTGDILIKGSTLAGTGAISIANGKNLTLNLSSNSTFANAINGTNANLIKDGAGTLTLSANTAYSGSTTINGGTLQFNENKAFNAISIASGATLALGPNKQFDFNSS
ncbi:MAG: beta strand repeat-containing protein, partial [Flavobacteriales bacterium]